MSMRESILAAISATLISANVASGRVYRSRTAAIDNMPAISIEPSRDIVSENVIGLRDHELDVAVSVFVTGVPPDAIADPVLEAAIAAIYAAPNLGLGNEVMVRAEYSSQWDFDDFDYARVTALIQVSYRAAT